VENLLDGGGVTEDIEWLTVVEILHGRFEPVDDPRTREDMTQLRCNSRDDTRSVFLLGLGGRGLVGGDPALIRALPHAEQIGLPALRNGELFVQPGQDVLDRPVLGDWLTLGQTGEQKANLLKRDANGTPLLGTIVGADCVAGTERRGLDLDPEYPPR
jgi:hypothetical protein